MTEEIKSRHWVGRDQQSIFVVDTEWGGGENK